MLGSPVPPPTDVIENTLKWDDAKAAAVSAISAFYVSAAASLAGLRRLCPRLVVAKAPIASHGRHGEVSEVVNAVIDRFLASLDERAEA